MGNEIELISDGDGLAVIGSSVDVERFLVGQGLDLSPSKALDMHRLGSLLGSAGVAAQAGSELAANSGRWVKLTAESAKDVNRYGLISTTTAGVSHAVIGKPGRVKKWVQIEKGPALVSGPVALATLSAMMQQRALQQQMDEIVEYLEGINEKVDEILQGQKDAVLADMIGVDLTIGEALTVRETVGRVSEVTWSKVQAVAMTLAQVQGYALLQLDAITEELQKHVDIGEVAKATSEAEPKVREWLVILARTLQLQDGVAVLELDRVLDASPDELDRHRLGLTTARQHRLELVSRSTASLLTRMDETIRTANSKVLLNPFDSPKAVQSSNQITAGVLDFRKRLDIESRQAVGVAKPWGRAVSETRDRVLATAVDGAHTAKQFGGESLDRAADLVRSARNEIPGSSGEPRGTTDEAARGLSEAAAQAARSLGTLFRRNRSAETAGHDTTPTDSETYEP